MSDPQQLNVLHGQMMAMLSAGDAAGAIAAAQAMLRQHSRYLAAYRGLAWAALLSGQDTQAQDLLGRIVSGDPEDGEAWAHLAQLIQDNGDRHEALPYWVIAFDLRPWGVSWPRPVDVRGGLRRAKLAQDALPGGRISLTPAALGHALIRGGHWRRGAAVLRPLAQANPNRHDIKLALAGACWHMNDLRTAAGLAREILEILPYALKANLIVAAGRGTGADAARERVASLDPAADYARRWFGSRLQV